MVGLRSGIQADWVAVVRARTMQRLREFDLEVVLDSWMGVLEGGFGGAAGR